MAAASGSRVGLTLSPTVATSSHGLRATARSRWESKLHGDTASASSASVSALSGSLSQSHSLSRLSTLCLTSLSSSFFFFFYLGFFAFSVTPFGAECFVFFCFFVFFLIDYLGHGLLGWGVHGSWIGRMMGWGRS